MTSGLDAAMAAVGDRWTLLVVDALLDGPRRFSELQEAIPKVAPNVLTARLRRLEEQGLVAGARYSDRPPRVEYRVTEAGRELAGALRLLSRWGARDGGGEVEGPHHRSCGTPARGPLVLPDVCASDRPSRRRPPLGLNAAPGSNGNAAPARTRAGSDRRRLQPRRATSTKRPTRAAPRPRPRGGPPREGSRRAEAPAAHASAMASSTSMWNCRP